MNSFLTLTNINKNIGINTRVFWGVIIRLEIFIEDVYLSKAEQTIPMLSIIDDGSGMSHEEVVKMTTFGHKRPDVHDVDRIGRFGVGFKVLLYVSIFSDVGYPLIT